MCDRLLFHRRFSSNIFQEDFFHQEILVFFFFQADFFVQIFFFFQEMIFSLECFPQENDFSGDFCLPGNSLFFFLIPESFFPGYSLCFSGDFTIHIFSLLQEIFFFPWNFFFCSEYFFQKIGLQEKKNNFLRNKKKEKESPGKKKKRKNNPNPAGKTVSRK